MRRSPPGTDNAANFNARYSVMLRSGMNDKQNNGANQTYRLPSIPIRMRIRPAGRKFINENQPRGFKTQPMVALIRAVFFVRPSPLHARLDLYVTTHL
jgi:hypothetical protein